MEKEQLKKIFVFLEEKEKQKAPLKWKLINNEPLRKENLDIEITESDKLHVNYQITIDGKLTEIEGILNQLGTGRSEEHEFEPTYFMDDETEQYYNNNWEKVEDEILNKFYND